jgi:hypothetical protein
MDPYTFSLTLGGVGLGVMALSGFAQAAHSTHGHAHGHGADGHAHGAHPHTHAGHGHSHGHSHGHDAHGDAPHTHHASSAGTHHGTHESATGHVASRMLALLSPRVAFSVLVGVGAAGVLLRPVLTEPALLLASLGAGVAFEWLIVSPLWRFLFRFASAPAVTLDSAVSDEARAVTAFDAAGHGLVAVELDGQVVQLLATLNAAERGAARRVRAGDRLRIEAVDTARNRCTVTYLGA